MREKQTLVVSAIATLLALIVCLGFHLPAALTVFLTAAIVLPAPLFAARQHARQQQVSAVEAAALLGGSTQALLLLDAEGKVLSLSKGLRQLADLPAIDAALALQKLPAAWLSLITDLHQQALNDGHAHRQDMLEVGADTAAHLFSVSSLQFLAADASPQVLITWEDLNAQNNAAIQTQAQKSDLLERSQTFVQTLIDVIPQPVYVQHIDGYENHYTLINQAFCAAYNRSREELIRCSPQTLFEPLQASMLNNEDQAVVEGAAIFREDKSTDKTTGKDRFLIISKQSCLSPEGKRVIVGTHFDITPWRTAERELQQTLERERELRERSQSFIQRVIDVIPYPVHVKDAQSRYLIVNEAFMRERGCSREELLGQDPARVAEKMAQTDSVALEAERTRAELSQQEDKEIVAGKTLIKEEHNFHSITGKERFRTVFKHSCLDTDGQPAIVTAMFDVTQWRIAERELQITLAREKDLRISTQQFIQRFIDMIPQPVYIKNAENRYLMVNDAFAQEVRHARADIVGHTSHELAPLQKIGEESAREDAAVLAGENIFIEKRDFPRPDEPARDRIISKRLCLDVDGLPIIVGNHVNISALRKTEEELQAAMLREQNRSERIQSFLQRVIDVIPQEFYIKSPEGRILMVNRAFLKRRQLLHASQALGRSMEEMAIAIYQADPVINQCPEAMQEAAEYYRQRLSESVTEDAQVIAGKTILKEEHRLMHTTGEEHFFLIAKEACLDIENNPVIVCANFDITALRQAERTLQSIQNTKHIEGLAG